MTDSPTTLGRALAAAAAADNGQGLRFLDRHERETRVDWATVYARAQRAAGGLVARGVRPGDTVGLVLPTGPAFFDAFFGAVLAGAVPVPLYPPVRLGRLAEYHARTAAMLTAARCRLLLTDARTWRILGETVALARPALGAVDIDDVAGEPHVHDVTPDALAFVQFSSGTTVEPKPVALQHAAVLANAGAILGAIAKTDADQAGVSWLPLYHDMGLVGAVFVALLRAGDLTLLGPELFIGRPALWLRALGRTGALISPAPNFAYALCVDRITDAEMEGVDLSRWRYALNGAEPVSPATLRRFVDRFARWGLRPEALTPVYGLAEASLAVTFSALDEPFKTTRFDRHALADGRAVPDPEGVELVSVGTPLPGMAIDVPEDRVGPVKVRGPSLFAGYLHQPERTALAMVDGWLDTGDLGFVHDGELYLTGRAKDVVILRGQNHAPHEIEQAVDAVEGVRTGCAAAVAWRPEDAESEQLVVFVEVKAEIVEAATQRSGSALLGQGLRPRNAPETAPGIDGAPTLPSAVTDPDVANRCAVAILAATGLDPALVVLLTPGTLPRTSSGKIRRGEALRRWLAGELLPPEEVNAWRLAGALAKGTLAHWRTRLGR
ncbi:MAG: AMP-binding protein [Pseudomonadota bacterium]|nr:AMP-binding protein [Pseudomonadota bacterium]